MKTPKKTLKEQRRYARQPANFLIELVDEGRGERRQSAYVVDISEGGLSLETHKKMERGSSLTLKFKIPLIVQGDVVRMETKGSKFRYGVRFHSIRFVPQSSGLPRSRTSVRMQELGLSPKPKEVVG